MIIFLTVCAAALLFGLYLAHVVGFGWRTRRTVLRSDPRTRGHRDVRDRRRMLWTEQQAHLPRERTQDEDVVQS